MSRLLVSLLPLALLGGCGSLPVNFPGDAGLPGSRACSTTNPCATPLACDPSGECVECISDAQCSGATPACDATTRRCVACRGSLGCAAPYVCSPSAPVCVIPCLENTSCPGFIDGCRDNVCSTCNENDDCATGRFCDVPHGRCVACLSDEQCSGATPRCHQATGLCGACVLNADCGAGGVCFQGACRLPH